MCRVMENNNLTHVEIPEKKSEIVSSILVTLFCCTPFGIIAIVYAVQADSAYEKGEFSAYQRLLGKARSWRNWGIGLGVVSWLLYLLLVAVSAACS